MYTHPSSSGKGYNACVDQWTHWIWVDETQKYTSWIDNLHSVQRVNSVLSTQKLQIAFAASDPQRFMISFPLDIKVVLYAKHVVHILTFSRSLLYVMRTTVWPKILDYMGVVGFEPWKTRNFRASTNISRLHLTRCLKFLKFKPKYEFLLESPKQRLQSRTNEKPYHQWIIRAQNQCSLFATPASWWKDIREAVKQEQDFNSYESSNTGSSCK